MPYVTSFERLGVERGRREGKALGRREGKAQGRREGEVAGLKTGIALALNAKFGSASSGLIARVERMNDLERLRMIADRLATATTIGEVRSVGTSRKPAKAAAGQ
jgi:flagellar biosynthesis/type III secretory pathway protein FliH